MPRTSRVGCASPATAPAGPGSTRCFRPRLFSVLLAIDTSAGTSVAVVDLDAGILAEESVADTRSHAEVIGTLIESALRLAGVTPNELSGVVAGMGPGPFTGLRVGIAAA